MTSDGTPSDQTTGLGMRLVTGLLVTLLAPAAGHSTGGPAEACTTLEPGHMQLPRELEEIEYQLKVSEEVEAGGLLDITLIGTGFLTTAQFKGFLIQVREVSSRNIVGRFTVGEEAEAQYLQCSKVQDTVTHRGSNDKSSLTVSWRAPSDLLGKVTN